MKNALGIILLLLALYVPISLFANIPPFTTTQELWVYTYIDAQLQLPESIEIVQDSSEIRTIKTHNPIEDPQAYNLKFKEKSLDFKDNAVQFYGTSGLFVGLLLSGLAIMMGGDRE